MAAERSLIRVRTDVVLDVLVRSLHEAALERATGQGDGWLESMGWHARGLERERFAPARAPLPWLRELLAGAEAGEVVAGLVAAEPSGRPDPPDAPSWRVPGPGGHVRYYLALRAAEQAGCEDAEAGRRAWLTGFWRHCCKEALGPGGDAA